MPEMSGCPSGVRIGMVGASDWAAAGTGASRTTASRAAKRAMQRGLVISILLFRVCYCGPSYREIVVRGGIQNRNSRLNLMMNARFVGPR